MMTQERLRELLDYNPETGVFTWRQRTGSRALVGQATSQRPSPVGYLRIRLDGTLHYAHRLAFLWVTGAFPTHQVDHINGDKTDNRWCNIRLVKDRENRQNLGGARRDNIVGLLGVSKSRSGPGYRARIQVDGKQHAVGVFPTPEQAHAAYLAAKKDLHTHNERALQNEHPAQTTNRS